jgi:hypothetical protein
MLYMLALLLAQATPPAPTFPGEMKVYMTCKANGDNLECNGIRWQATIPGIMKAPTKPVKFELPSGTPVKLRKDLKPLAYSYDVRPEMVWPSKAGKSEETPFGTTLTRVTDSDTANGSSFFHFYSDRPAACGSKVIASSNGGSTSVIDLNTFKFERLNHSSVFNRPIHHYQWRTCDSLYLTSDMDLWEYTPSSKSFKFLRSFNNTWDASYLNLGYLSDDGTRMFISAEKASKNAVGVILVDENGTRYYPTNPLPPQYIPKLNSSFTAAGAGGVTRDGSHYVIQYNGSAVIDKHNVNTMSYVIPWKEDPRTYAATSIFGGTPTYHASPTATGTVAILGARTKGLSLDPESEECKYFWSSCGINIPDWFYALTKFDFSGTPDPKKGYPEKRLTSYTIAAGGYHVSTTHGDLILSSTYQERIGNDDYLIRSATHNELFFTYPDDVQEWVNLDGTPHKGDDVYTRPKGRTRIVRIAPTNTHEPRYPYWGQPRATFDKSGCMAVFTSTGGSNGRADLYVVTGYCE